MRASAVSALGKARVQTNALLAWGGWGTNMLKHYWRTDLDFRQSIQDKLTQ